MDPTSMTVMANDQVSLCGVTGGIISANDSIGRYRIVPDTAVVKPDLSRMRDSPKSVMRAAPMSSMRILLYDGRWSQTEVEVTERGQTYSLHVPVDN
jgi:hypothetical protein